MRRYSYVIIIFFLLTGCYVNKEHRDWCKRKEKKLSDNYFYDVLKDTCNLYSVELKYNIPYVCIQDSLFHAVTFDKDQNVYSNAWVHGKPALDTILANQYKIGYYSICGKSLIIETIGSWTLFNIPWKFSHKKEFGEISVDTIVIKGYETSIYKLYSQ